MLPSGIVQFYPTSLGSLFVKPPFCAPTAPSPLLARRRSRPSERARNASQRDGRHVLSVAPLRHEPEQLARLHPWRRGKWSWKARRTRGARRVGTHFERRRLSRYGLPSAFATWHRAHRPQSRPVELRPERQRPGRRRVLGGGGGRVGHRDGERLRRARRELGGHAGDARLPVSWEMLKIRMNMKTIIHAAVIFADLGGGRSQGENGLRVLTFLVERGGKGARSSPRQQGRRCCKR